ncbi:hypothetical protein IRZ71_00835 [Flavobacterium sp. ANB]|uniref:hypothetical protein n=1 Tax=unclassified Flavobacterium TaxID=196869 RepID=UPI0012B6E668|nr:MULTISPECIES: hypothetical protein [unclassified Flavobacterium]MBF4514867.1 hypothetical protein [Flavobacterium sp. ANB]MTD68193.1 hypothetical protein [Flavobacterium sp. LC2016-13]
MRNYIWSFLLFFCVIFVSFSQTKTLEKGTYVSTNKGQKIKLNLLENNKYELVFYSGEYKIKGDSLLFVQTEKAENSFNLSFKNDKKAQKIKIKFLEPSIYSFYIGTQNGSEPVQYQKLNDIKTKVDPDWININVDFEIDRADYLYLVYEGYETESKISKYALPKDVSEITIKYELDALGNLNLAGFLDKSTNELKISEQGGKNPLVFVNAKEAQPDAEPTVKPIENKSVLNWTYPGKDALINEDFGQDVTVDTAVAVITSQYNFKFKTENNLKSAIAATKIAKSKFLVVYTDSKNPTAKADFDAVLKDLETQVGYYMYDAYNAQYDVFNYYLATADDKKWLKTNKISDSPGLIILNGDGDVLATAKSNLIDKKSEFTYYDEFTKKLQRASAFYAFNKAAKNKKVTDVEVVSAFYKASILDIPYDYETTDAVTVTPEVNPADFKIAKVTLDKKEVAQIWKKLIETHQKDTKPNRELVETILREIKNVGFTKQFFNEERVFNDTDFLAIDYLLKHYDAIEKMNIEDENGNALALLKGSLSFEISSALQQNSYVTQEGVAGKANQNKIIAIYKKLIATGKGSFDCYKNYFDYLNADSENSIDDIAFLKEFKSYFNTYLSTEKGNAIERLDEMFTRLDTDSDYSYNGWNSFKDYHSNLVNTAAWATVLKPANNGFIKDAISWSEYSLVVTKNNPYYLDTLAQLYYKDGQKDKAIATQELAVKFLTAEVEEQTATEIRETLSKMQNGTY